MYKLFYYKCKQFFTIVVSYICSFNKSLMKNGLCLIFILFLVSCSVQTDINKKQFDIKEVKSKIDSANLKYADRFTTNDSLWYVDRYCNDACVLPPNATKICGVDSLRKYFYGNGENKPIEMIIKATNVYGSQEAVIEEGIYDFPDGKGGSFDKGKFIAIWKEENGKWKLSNEIWNSDIQLK